MTDRVCQKWFAKFCAGDFSLDDAPQSGRPIEVDNDQIETLPENNQCYTMWKIYSKYQIYKVIVGNENCTFILWKKLNGLFGQPNVKHHTLW